MTMVLRLAANGFGGGVMVASIGMRELARLVMIGFARLRSLCALFTTSSMLAWSTMIISRLPNGFGGGVMVASMGARVDFNPLMKG